MGRTGSVVSRSLMVGALVNAPAAWAEERVVVADFSSAVAAGKVPAGWELSETSGGRWTSSSSRCSPGNGS
jgi:hypothetical protein